MKTRFITGEAHKGHNCFTGSYDWNPEEKEWQPTDPTDEAFIDGGLSADKEGYPIAANDWGDYRLSGTIIDSNGEETVVPLNPSDFWGVLWDGDWMLEKEGPLHLWPTVEAVTTESILGWAKRYGFTLVDTEKTRLEVLETVQCCFSNEETGTCDCHN